MFAVKNPLKTHGISHCMDIESYLEPTTAQDLVMVAVFSAAVAAIAKAKASIGCTVAMATTAAFGMAVQPLETGTQSAMMVAMRLAEPIPAIRTIISLQSSSPIQVVWGVVA